MEPVKNTPVARDCTTCAHGNKQVDSWPCRPCLASTSPVDRRPMWTDARLVSTGEVKVVKPEVARAPSIVSKPAHYARYSVEPITFIMGNGMEFWRGNIIKYAARAGHKIYDGMDQKQSEITDLEKVRRYAEMRINQLKGEAVL